MSFFNSESKSPQRQFINNVWCRELKMRVILSDDFEDDASTNLLDTFMIYLSIHIAHKKYLKTVDVFESGRQKVESGISAPKICSFLFEKKLLKIFFFRFGLVHQVMTHINPLRSSAFSNAFLAGLTKFCWRKPYYVLKR